VHPPIRAWAGRQLTTAEYRTWRGQRCDDRLFRHLVSCQSVTKPLITLSTYGAHRPACPKFQGLRGIRAHCFPSGRATYMRTMRRWYDLYAQGDRCRCFHAAPGRLAVCLQATITSHVSSTQSERPRVPGAAILPAGKSPVMIAGTYCSVLPD
jgi:hypothetical protein